MSFAPKKVPTGMTGGKERIVITKKIRRTLRRKSKSDVATAKDEIQGLVRQIVIVRDGGCILRHIRRCGGEVSPYVVLQADHLVTRANSATYDDTRLIVCLCRDCHGWKHWHKEEYDELVRSVLPPERVALWDRAEKDSWRPVHHVASDWRLSVAALKQELEALQKQHG